MHVGMPVESLAIGMNGAENADIQRPFIDDYHKPSKEGRRTLSLNTALLAKQLEEPRLEVLSMDLLMACDKAEAREVLAKVTDILQGQV